MQHLMRISKQWSYDQKSFPITKLNHGIKICLEAKNLHALERAYNEALTAGLPCVMITDLGYTVFEGQPTITAVGIGPCKKEEVHHILKRYQLMK